MHLTVNGEGVELAAAPTVEQLVAGPRARAPPRGGRGQRRRRAAQRLGLTPLAPGDAVELLVAVAGG